MCPTLIECDAGFDLSPQPSAEMVSNSPVVIEESDCSHFSVTGWLSAPQRTSALTLNVSLVLGNSGDQRVCELHTCVLDLHPKGRVQRRYRAFDKQQEIAWIVSSLQEGPNRATLIVKDSEDAKCTWTTAIDFVVDHTSPVCDPRKTEQESSTVYIVVLKCSEEIVLTHPERISISKNGRLSSAMAHNSLIRIEIQTISFRDAHIFLRIPGDSYTDLAGNHGELDRSVKLPLTSMFLNDKIVQVLEELPVDGIVSGTIAVSGGLTTGAAILGSAESSGGVGLKSNIVRTGFHIQFLTFTAHLAVPRLSRSYITTAEKFSWTTLAFGKKEAAEADNDIPSGNLSVKTRKTIINEGRRLSRDSDR